MESWCWSVRSYIANTYFIAYQGVNIGEGFNEFERYDKVEAFLKQNNNAVTMQKCEELLNEIGVVYNGTDRLQWSVVYNLSTGSGRSWPFRDSEKAWDF